MPYKAFISYSHAADANLAPMLQSALQQFAKPWNQLRAMRIFVDKASLSANPGLWSTIEATLSASEFFILLASPTAAQSVWVQREVEHWLRLDRARNLLLVLTEGEIVWSQATRDFDWSKTDALPVQLRGAMSEEPLWIDMRWAKSGTPLSLEDARFSDAVASLASQMRGVPKDDLYGEHVTQHKKLVAIRRVVISALVILAMGVMTTAIVAYQEANEARIQTSFARAGASEAALTQKAELLPYSAVLAVEAMQLFPSIEADQAIRDSLELLPRALSAMQHPSPVTAMAVQPGGTRVVSAGGDGVVRLWTLGSPSSRKLANYYRARSTPFVFSADGKRMATIAEDGAAQIWDVETEQPVGGPLKPDGRIALMAFSKDGELLATSNLNGTRGGLSVWRIRNGELLKSIHFDRVATDSQGLDFDNEGHLAMAVYADVRIWNSASWEELRFPSNIKTSTRKLLFSPDGRLLVHAASVGLRVFDAHSLELVVTRPSQPSDIVFSPDGKLFAASTGSEAGIWDTEKWSEIAKVKHGGAIRAMAFDPGGSLFATAGGDLTAVVWSARSGTKRAEMVHGDKVREVAFSADGQRLITASADKSVRVWESTGASAIPQIDRGADNAEMAFAPQAAFFASVTDRVLSTWRPSARQAETTDFAGNHRSVVLCSNGEMVAAAGIHDQVQILETDTRRPVAILQHPGDIDWMEFTRRVQKQNISYRDSRATAAQQERAASRGTVDVLACSPDGKYIVTARADFLARIWDVAAQKVIASRPYQFDTPHAVFSPDGRFAALIQNNDVLEVIEIRDGRVVFSSRGEQLVGNPVFSANSGVLVVAEAAAQRNKGTLVRGFRTSDWSVTPAVVLEINTSEVVLSPDGSILATGIGSKLAQVFRTDTGKEIARLEHESDVKALAFSPNGKVLAIGGGESLRAWDLEKNRELSQLVRHEAVFAVAFSPDSLYLATGGDTAAHVFSVDAGREMVRVAQDGGVTRLLFSTDARYVASAGSHSTRIWMWRSNDLIAETCNRFDRTLTPEQWPRLAGEEGLFERLQKACVPQAKRWAVCPKSWRWCPG